MILEIGFVPPQRAIQEYEEGENVHLKIDPSVHKGRFHPVSTAEPAKWSANRGTRSKSASTTAARRKR